MSQLLDLSRIWLNKSGPRESIESLASNSPRDLATLIVNEALNRLISARDGGMFGERGPMDYQGWFWRSVDFFTPGGITIADGNGRVAICQSNKWDYPQRDLTEAEQEEFLRLVWAAYLESCKGGNLGEIHALTDANLILACDYIASLDIEQEDES